MESSASSKDSKRSLILVAFETDDNYPIQFEMKNTIRTALINTVDTLQ